MGTITYNFNEEVRISIMTILWLKAFHIFFMVAWFAGIFYLPRLFVYHSENNHDKTADTLKVMERRLLFFVTPFAIFTLIFGTLLISQYGAAWFKQGTNTTSDYFTGGFKTSLLAGNYLSIKS